MTKAASLAIISLLTGIVACPLVAATEARAHPYVVTIDQEGANVVATGSGEFDLAGLGVQNIPSTINDALINSSVGTMQFVPGAVSFNLRDFFFTPFTGPLNFGSGPPLGATTSTGSTVGLSPVSLSLPPGYTTGQPLLSTNTFDGMNFTDLGITPGTFTWTWGTAADQSFTINVVPGPIVGAGLPGLIAALGGLVAIARRRRKQLA